MTVAQGAAATWWAGTQIARFRPKRYVLGGSLWALNHSLPLVTGLLLKALFDRVADPASSLAAILAVIAGFVAAEAIRAAVLWGANVAWPLWWLSILAMLRGNLLGSLLLDREPPAARLPGSSGEALGRARDDTEDVVWFVDVWVDVAGGLFFTVVALAVMVRIDAAVALAVVLPMVAVLVGTRLLSQRIKATHGTSRASGAEVTSFVGELVNGALALKVAGAEDAALQRLRQVNRRRGEDAVRAKVVGGELTEVISTAGAELAIGLVLLLVAGDLRRGDITVGDLALFTTYAGALTGLPRWVGRMLARHRQATVSLERIARLREDRSVASVVAPRPVDLHRPPASRAAPDRSVEDPLRRLDVQGLTAHHPGSAHRGIDGVSFALAAGTLTVVTGPVGAGKTTLVRAVLGLLPVEAGTICWNGTPVDDPARFLVPPRAAYAGQVARLFSAALGDNLQLGWQATDREVAEAIALAAFDADVAELPEGLATLVGPRGVRLSGGQLQRASAARALLRRPQLLVIDDLSSALDVETEIQLWERLAGSGMTILAVSTRRAALKRADQVLTLADGRLVE